jgi:hypothetical protein
LWPWPPLGFEQKSSQNRTTTIESVVYISSTFLFYFAERRIYSVLPLAVLQRSAQEDLGRFC